MSKQQPDEQDSSAHYQRADPAKFPASEAGQRAAVEGMATAEGWTGPGLSKAVREHNRRREAEGPRLETDRSRADALRDKMLALFAEMDEAAEVRRTGPEAAHGVREVADRYGRAISHQERDDIAEQAGATLNLPEAGLIRRLAKALERTLPDLIVDAHVDGMSAPQIARELACSDRHAYQVIRDRPWEARWTLYRATGDDEWEEVTAGTTETTETADDLADRLWSEHRTDDLARSGARVSVWRAGDGNDPDDARGECEIPPSTQTGH